MSALIAFFVGGLVAAWSAHSHNHHVRGDAPAHTVHHDVDHRPNKGWLQGLMVWAVTIPLSAWLVGSAVTGLARTGGNIAAAGVQAAGESVDVSNELDRRGVSTTQAAGNTLQDAARRAQANATPARIEAAADSAAKTSWGLLVSMLLALGGAVGGGAMGSRIRE